jgi:DNA mismatch repair protein MutS2
VIEFRTLQILEYDKVVQSLSQLAHSEEGIERCRRLEPTTDLSEVEARLKATDDAVHVILEKAIPPLSGFGSIRKALAHAETGATLSCAELLAIGQFLRALTRLYAFAPNEVDAGANEVYAGIRRLRPLNNLEKAISMAIAGEEEVFDHASLKLSGIRRRIRDTQAEVKAMLDKILRTHKASLQEQLVTMRGSRYVVPVRADHRGDIQGIIHDTSSSGATLFVEPLSVIEINNRIRELMADERDEIERILAELSASVRMHAVQLEENTQIVGFIDFTVAKGRLALSMNAMPPRMNRDGRILLKRARHPLIPAGTVVPVTIEIGTRYKSLVITGPNTGGKTVSLKTCGLLTLMAMAGLMIPADENSDVSVFREIAADIGDEQSIEQSLSTFSSHMSKLVRIVRSAAPSTLVLVDELGSGTDPSEGAALAIAILEHLRRNGCTTMATTHYRELKEYALVTDGVENACCEFDIETLRPTYKLLIGVPGVSNAFAISSRLGLPDDIIAKAGELLTGRDKEFESVIVQTEKARKEAEALRDAARLEFADASAAGEEARRIRAELEARQKEILLKSREKAKEFTEDAYAELDALLEDVRHSMKERDLEESKALMEEARANIRARQNAVEGEIAGITLGLYNSGSPPENLTIGETYHSMTLGVSGMLTELNLLKGTGMLMHGNRRVRVPLSTLRSVDRKQQSSVKSGRRSGSATGDLSLSKKMNAVTEIKLLGLTVDEACEILDKFIDDSVLSGIRSIRIVHGKGTGALRSAVASMLKKDRRVREFRLAGYGEGDSGVTIAEL